MLPARPALGQRLEQFRNTRAATLLGLDAETGIFMLLYLDLAYDDMRSKGLMRSREDLREAPPYAIWRGTL
jgi:hypothetical protein